MKNYVKFYLVASLCLLSVILFGTSKVNATELTLSSDIITKDTTIESDMTNYGINIDDFEKRNDIDFNSWNLMMVAEEYTDGEISLWTYCYNSYSITELSKYSAEELHMTLLGNINEFDTFPKNEANAIKYDVNHNIMAFRFDTGLRINQLNTRYYYIQGIKSDKILSSNNHYITAQNRDFTFTSSLLDDNTYTVNYDFDYVNFVKKSVCYPIILEGAKKNSFLDRIGHGKYTEEADVIYFYNFDLYQDAGNIIEADLLVNSKEYNFDMNNLDYETSFKLYAWISAVMNSSDNLKKLMANPNYLNSFIDTANGKINSIDDLKYTYQDKTETIKVVPGEYSFNYGNLVFSTSLINSPASNALNNITASDYDIDVTNFNYKYSVLFHSLVNDQDFSNGVFENEVFNFVLPQNAKLTKYKTDNNGKVETVLVMSTPVETEEPGEINPEETSALDKFIDKLKAFCKKNFGDFSVSKLIGGVIGLVLVAGLGLAFIKWLFRLPSKLFK